MTDSTVFFSKRYRVNVLEWFSNMPSAVDGHQQNFDLECLNKEYGNDSN
jgi:hypothetical protein